MGQAELIKKTGRTLEEHNETLLKIRERNRQKQASKRLIDQEALGEFDRLSKKFTGKTVAEWDEIYKQRFSKHVTSGHLKLDKLMAQGEMLAKVNYYGLHFDDIIAVDLTPPHTNGCDIRWMFNPERFTHLRQVK